jgi:hypothetical protein
MSPQRDLPIRIIVMQPPTCFPDAAFGLQDQSQHLQIGTPTPDGGLSYTCTLTLLHQPRLDTLDFRGAYVHGKVCERFLYLSHGTLGADGRWLWHQRWKLMLGSLPPELIESTGANGVQGIMHQLSGTRPIIEWTTS